MEYCPDYRLEPLRRRQEQEWCANMYQCYEELVQRLSLLRQEKERLELQLLAQGYLLEKPQLTPMLAETIRRAADLAAANGKEELTAQLDELCDRLEYLGG